MAKPIPQIDYPSATQVQIHRFTVAPDDLAITINYSRGYQGDSGHHVALEQLTRELTQAEVQAIMSDRPEVYEAIKEALYGVIAPPIEESPAE